MGIFIGKVISIEDKNNGWRIKARIEPDDKGKEIEKIDYAFPLLPKIFFIKPKINEYVIILTKDNTTTSQRFYIGPIISQPQCLYKSDSPYTYGSMLKNGNGIVYKNIDIFSNSNGALPKDDEIGISGRKNSDIIISDNDIRIRCGCKILNQYSTKEDEILIFNKRNNPSYIKLTFHENPLISENGKKITSTANIVGQHINLISTDGNPYIEDTADEENKLLSDKTLCEIVDNLSPAVYGDKLVDFLKTFIEAFKTHTHKYSNLPPCESMSYKSFVSEASKIENNILSKNVRLN